ncbi:hypothetical protein MMC30_003164 [Trapelia coarctata]|nr:hypothetical protein [Trapelia coarctata]
MNRSKPLQVAVTVSLTDLQRGKNTLNLVLHVQWPDTLSTGDVPFEALEEAFGLSSLGILVVKDLPSKFTQLRETVLSYASYLANLNPEILGSCSTSVQFFSSNEYEESLSSPEAKYLVGWSHGKETLKTGQYDTLKGSYYINCAFYQSPELQAAPADDKFPNFPEYTALNIWPPESLLPGFEAAVTELCTLIIDTAVLVARACDLYASAHIEEYKSGYLERVVKTSLTTKARLLHYFPPDPSQKPETKPGAEEDDEGSWCATHLDHGCLTGLTSAIFINETLPLPTLTPARPLPALSTLSSSPDPVAGLYIRSRTGATTKVNIPSDCLAFQTGEALEVITQGKFRAVPHFVRGPRLTNRGGMRVVRNTLAIFTQPNLGEVVDAEEGVTFGEFAQGVVERHT